MSATTAAVRDWCRNRFTAVFAVLVAVAVGVMLWLNPPSDDVAGPPSRIETAKVGGYCARIVTGFDGTVWALAPGSRDGELRRVDAADVVRDSPECKSVATPGAGNRTGR